MHVRKFEADSLEEALGNIKTQLGPDAIILKTVTNKGLKGAFKKKKIEITAAISEKNYVRKARVDNVLDGENKDKLYSNSSNYISNIIDDYDNHNVEVSNRLDVKTKNNSYGNLGINKQVQSAKNIGTKIKSGLDDFLSLGQNEKDLDSQELHETQEDQINNTSSSMGQELSTLEIEELDVDLNQFQKEEPPVEIHQNLFDNNQLKSPELESSMGGASSDKIEELEKQIFMLSKTIEKIENKEPVGLYHLRTTLTGLDISSKFIQNLTRKALFELTEDQLMNVDYVFEYALGKMNSCIQVGMPLFSSVDIKDPVVTIFISESEVGQTKMAHKVGALRNDSILIKNLTEQDRPTKKDEFCEKMLDVQVVNTDSVPQIVSECRKAIDDKRSIFIDYKNRRNEIGETKKFIDGVRRSFKNVEVLLSLSSINTEMYNRKMASRYRSLSNGIIISNLDLCLNYGALFNICDEYADLPLKFFGTGEVVPDDLEAATSERILAGLFEL